jgi:hypothetical protein
MQRAAEQICPAFGLSRSSKVLRGCPEVLEVKSTEVPRLEKYLRFHLAEILEELTSNDERESDPESIWSAKWGSSAEVLKECLLRSRDEITSALAECRKAHTATALLVERRLICDGSKLFRGQNSVLCATRRSRSGGMRRIGSLTGLDSPLHKVQNHNEDSSDAVDEVQP